MALDGTYTGLKASIAGWLHRDDLTSTIPDLVTLAEARIARDLRVRRQVATTVLTTAPGVQGISLPADYLELENVSLAMTVSRNLLYVNIEHLNARFPDGGYTGAPVVYTLEANNILLGPVPDAIYSVELLYYARWSPLATTPANWLLSNHPDVYLFGALAEAGDWIKDNEGTQKWENKYQRSIKQVQDADDESMFSGSALRVRTI